MIKLLFGNQGNYGDAVFLFYSDAFVNIFTRNICECDECLWRASWRQELLSVFWYWLLLFPDICDSTSLDILLQKYSPVYFFVILFYF